MGQVEIKARVARGKQTYTSPVTQQECVWYRSMVADKTSSKNTKDWAMPWIRTAGDDVYVEDGTGEVLVKLPQADVKLTPAIDKKLQTERTGLINKVFSDPPKKDPLIEHLEELGAPTQGTVHVVETILQPGDEVYVFGRAMDNPDVQEASEVHGHKDIIISKNSPNDFFTVTDESENKVKLRLLGEALATLLVGIGILAFGIYRLIA